MRSSENITPEEQSPDAFIARIDEGIAQENIQLTEKYGERGQRLIDGVN